jgi:RNA polymerase sigma-70 factor, ECF subfamily
MTDIKNIWTDFHKELKGFVLSKTRNAMDTDDILQDVFVKIIQNQDKVSQAINVRHYIYGIVRNTVNDYFRKRKSNACDHEAHDILSEAESESLNEKIAACCLKLFIQQLPEAYRQALLVTEFQQLSQKQLAEQLNISYSGAKSRVQRGKEKLKELILNCCAYKSDAYGNLMIGDQKDCFCP